MPHAPFALITGGGTKARVDAVRCMANDAEGDMAVDLARAFARTGVPSVLVLSRFAWYKHRFSLPSTAEVVLYNFFEEYVEALDRVVVDHGCPAFALSAAAVSDYGLTTPVPGKMASDREVLDLSVPRLPKVLGTWRERFGKACILAGFKFLTRANSSLDDLIAAARRQNERCHLNATVGNFKEEIGGGKHPIWWITPDGGTVRVEGMRDDVARAIVDFCLRYRDTTWARSERDGEADPAVHATAEGHLAREILGFAQETRLFTGTTGNLSVRLPDGGILVSPRGVDKATLSVEDLIPARLDLPARVVRYRGPAARKPSIDAHVHLLLGDVAPASLHVHGAWVLGNPPVTRLAYPCGTAEQAAMVREALAARVRTEGLFNADGRALVEERDHGHLLFFRDAAAFASLRDAWVQAVATWRAHVADIGAEAFLGGTHLTPLFHLSDIVGVLPEREGIRAPFLLPAWRDRRLGEGLAHLLDSRRARVAVHRECGVRRWYQERGFRATGEISGFTLLDPPSLRDDLRFAATLCLRCVHTNRILLVRRSPRWAWPDAWAVPGGHMQASDAHPFAAAVRELFEETGVDLTGTPPPAHSHPHTSGWTHPETGESRAWRIQAFHLDLLDEPVPTVDGVEIMEARWVTEEEARTLPMGPATRAMVREAFVPG